MERSTAPRSRWIASAALAVALLSLALNGVLLWKLRDPAKLAAPAVSQVLHRLAESDARLKYEVRIPAGTPVHFDVPFDQTYRVRINTTLPIDTRVGVPVRGPLGTFNATVPIRADLPIRTEVPVRIRDTFRLRTQTQTEYVVPLEVRLSDLPLQDIDKALDP